MKKAAVCMVCVAVICFLQFGRDVKVNSSMRSSGENGTEEFLDITANRLLIFDKEGFAQEIIRRRIENSFQEIYFVERYPDEIKVDVYLDRVRRKMRCKAFSIEYEYDGDGGYKWCCR